MSAPEVNFKVSSHEYGHQIVKPLWPGQKWMACDDESDDEVAYRLVSIMEVPDTGGGMNVEYFNRPLNKNYTFYAPSLNWFFENHRFIDWAEGYHPWDQAVNASRYPHKCTRCGFACFEGYNQVDCTNINCPTKRK